MDIRESCKKMINYSRFQIYVHTNRLCDNLRGKTVISKKGCRVLDIIPFRKLVKLLYYNENKLKIKKKFARSDVKSQLYVVSHGNEHVICALKSQVCLLICLNALV